MTKRLALLVSAAAIAGWLSAAVLAEEGAARPFPRPAEVYSLPEGTQFTEMEAKYARACVAYVEARLNVVPSQKAWSDVVAVRVAFAKAAPPGTDKAPPRETPPLPDTPPALSEDGGGKTEPPAPTPATEPAAANGTPLAAGPLPVPSPAVMPGELLTLAAGTAFAAIPVSEPVGDKQLLPVATQRTAGVSIAWGECRETLNLFDLNAANAPMHVEASLNGGPWLAARYGDIRVPDLGPGNYQIRIVAWPSRGRSIVLAPVVLERTKTGWTRR